MDRNNINKNKKDEWYTPKYVVDMFSKAIKFDLDVASNEYNSKRLDIPNYYSKENSGLDNKWYGKVWCNPPFSLKKEFVYKALKELVSGNCSEIYMLLPMSFETRLFHNFIFPNAKKIYIPDTRLRFADENKMMTKSPEFASCIIKFDKYYSDEDVKFVLWNLKQYWRYELK